MMCLWLPSKHWPDNRASLTNVFCVLQSFVLLPLLIAHAR